MEHSIRLSTLRKSAWGITNEAVSNDADPPQYLWGQLWAFTHATTNVDSARLTSRTGRTTTVAELTKMFKDAQGCALLGQILRDQPR